jgi:hypothetical protein
MPKGPELTHEALRQVLHYEPLTGVFTWMVRPSRRTRAGDVAGTLDKDGHRVIKYQGRFYFAHRLAVLYMTGRWPTGIVDHRDTDPDNNRWDNLRDTDQVTNMQNQRRAMSSSKSGVLGVHWCAIKQRWIASIRLASGRTIRRHHKAIAEGSAAYLELKRQHHAGCTL